MPFDSYAFVLLLLPLLVLAWRMVAIVHREALGTVLLVFSLLVCLWVSPAGLALLLVLVPVNYCLGLALAAPGERESSLRRRGLLILALLVNFLPLILLRAIPLLAAGQGLPGESLLGASLFPDTFLTRLAPRAVPEGGTFVLQTAELAGFSFWVLVQTAWLVSVFLRHIEPEGLYRHALFSCAFPYFLAGPIVRYQQLGSQFDNLSAPPVTTLVTGMGLFVAGLAKKVLLADWLGSHVGPIFAAAGQGLPVTCPEAWFGTLAFSFQIYFDFSGYTDMALGLGLMLGLRLPENFHSPYRATGFIDFWRRWHLTLSAWLRDCLYQPIAGPWPSRLRLVLAMAATLLVAGLWHGTALTFLVWAGLHGLFLGLNALFRLVRGTTLTALCALLPVRALFVGLTFLVVTLTWVVFRADSLQHALTMYGLLFGQGQDLIRTGGWFANGYVTSWISALPLLASCVLVFALPTAHDVFLGRRDGTRAWISFACTTPWAIVLAVATLACLAVMDRARPFIF